VTAAIGLQSLATGELFDGLACRSNTQSLFRSHGSGPNPYLNLAVAVPLGMQLLSLFLPGLRGALGAPALGLLDLVVSGLGAFSGLALNEALAFREIKKTIKGHEDF
jgi:Ca2+-transporting ATPase